MKRVFAVVLLILGIVFIGACGGNDEKVVFSINGEKISQDEIEFYVDKNKSNAVLKFSDYKGDIDDAFWNKDFDGVTPTQYLNYIAFKECVENNIILQEGYSKKINDYKDFQGLIKSMENTNKENEKKVENGEVFYGNTNYDLKTYVAYAVGNTVAKIQRALLDKEVKVTEEEVQKYYSENKEKFKKIDNIKFEIYSFEFKDKINLPSNEEIQQATDILNSIDFTNSNNKLPDEIKKEIIDVNNDSYRRLIRSHATIMDICLEMAEGDVSEVINDGSRNIIVRCAERKDGGFMSSDADEVEEALIYDIEQTKVKETIDSLYKESKVKIVDSQFEMAYQKWKEEN